MSIINLITGKKADAATQAQLEKNLTANELINVRDIEGSIVYTKDDKLYSYVNIMPLSLELLSEEERILKARQFTAEFSAIPRTFKFLTMSRPVDVSFMLDNLADVNGKTQNLKRKEMIRNKMAEINRFPMSGDTLEHNFFMAIWVQNKKDGQKELLKFAADVISRFKSCGIEVSLCQKEDIIRLFNLFANPNYVHLEDVDIEEHVPFC